MYESVLIFILQITNHNMISIIDMHLEQKAKSNTLEVYFLTSLFCPSIINKTVQGQCATPCIIAHGLRLGLTSVKHTRT